jgi:IS5 family transposase
MGGSGGGGAMLRIYLLQQWFNLSDPGVEEALYDSARGCGSLWGIDLGLSPRR